MIKSWCYTILVIFLGVLFSAKISLAELPWGPGKPWYDPYKRGLTPREIKPFGQIEEDERRIREKLRQIRFQEERTPRDIRVAAPVEIAPPGATRPTTEFMRRGRNRLTGKANDFQYGDPIKGYSYPVNDPNIEHMPTDPRAIGIQQNENVVEWWEVSEQSRGQRAEWFRSRLGLSQELRMAPQQQQQQMQRVPGMMEGQQPGIEGEASDAPATGLGPPTDRPGF